MKTRNGFVSNSSSSSFIIGIAEIVNEGRVMKYLRNSKLWEFNRLEILKTNELDFVTNENGTTTYIDKLCEIDKGVSWDGKDILMAWVEAPTNDGESCQGNVEVSPDKTLLIVRIGHNEDDGPFIRQDGFSGLDYSIVNEDYFENEFPDSYKVLELLKGKKGMTNVVAFRYGVSRCG